MKSSAIIALCSTTSRIYMKEEQTCSIFHSLLKFLNDLLKHSKVTRSRLCPLLKIQKNLPTNQKALFLLLLAPTLIFQGLGQKGLRKPFILRWVKTETCFIATFTFEAVLRLQLADKVSSPPRQRVHTWRCSTALTVKDGPPVTVVHQLLWLKTFACESRPFDVEPPPFFGGRKVAS